MAHQRSINRLLMGALAAGVALVAARASADCDASGNPIAGSGSGACYQLRGSDTLYDIFWAAINDCRGTGCTGATQQAAKDLFYLGTGSGNAENNMKAASASNTHLGSQSIGPMSRNFRPSIIDPKSSTYTQRVSGNTGAAGHAGVAGTDPAAGSEWYPDYHNVMCLDAGVFPVRGNKPAGFSSTPFTDSAGGVALDKFVPNNVSLPYDGSQDCGTLPTAWLNPTANFSNLWEVVLSGVDGSGTWTACADPRRVQAVKCLGKILPGSGNYVRHVYRRDDNSGTTDTYKDRIMVVPNSSDVARYPWTGGRFCNGAALGGIISTTLQQGLCSVSRTVCTTDTGSTGCPSGEKCWFNLNNPDFDPIRRPCDSGLNGGENGLYPAPASGIPNGYAYTSCTDLTTGLPCQGDDNNPNCTQGLIVALSDTDPANAQTTDVTTSIANRVAADTFNHTPGYAGRESVNPTLGFAKAMPVNTQDPTGKSGEDKIRKSVYVLARRLYVQNSYGNVDGATYPFDVPDDLATGGGGSDQLTKEQAFYNNYLTVRSKMDPWCPTYGFLTCCPTAGGDPSTCLAGNLCYNDPGPATPSPYVYQPSNNFVPSGALTGSSGGTRALKWDGTAVPVVTSGTLNTGSAAAPSGWSEGHVCTTSSPCTCSPAAPCLAGTPVALSQTTGSVCITNPPYTINVPSGQSYTWPYPANCSGCTASITTYTTCPSGIGTGASQINYQALLPSSSGPKKPHGAPCTPTTALVGTTVGECASGNATTDGCTLNTFGGYASGQIHDLYCQ